VCGIVPLSSESGLQDYPHIFNNPRFDSLSVDESVARSNPTQLLVRHHYFPPWQPDRCYWLDPLGVVEENQGVKICQRCRDRFQSRAAGDWPPKNSFALFDPGYIEPGITTFENCVLPELSRLEAILLGPVMMHRTVFKMTCHYNFHRATEGSRNRTFTVMLSHFHVRSRTF
jgi:hypothetical protein